MGEREQLRKELCNVSEKVKEKEKDVKIVTNERNALEKRLQLVQSSESKLSKCKLATDYEISKLKVTSSQCHAIQSITIISIGDRKKSASRRRR